MSKFKSKTKRMFSGTAEYHKFDIAHGQLETAIRLFLVDGCDMFSAITLAGAAGEVLHELVLRAGKRPFVDCTVKFHDWKELGPTPSRGAVMKHIHKLLFINEMSRLFIGGSCGDRTHDKRIKSLTLLINMLHYGQPSLANTR